MKYILDPIKDEIYPVLSEQEIRRDTARGILVNDKNEIYLLHVQCEDIFGVRDHYELPGGGLNPCEEPDCGLRREILEETGYTIRDIQFVGHAAIEYHLLKRWDIASIFVCHTDTLAEQRLEDYEKEIFVRPVWVPVSEILTFYEQHHAITVGGMIHKRDEACIREAFRLNLIGE